MKTRRFFYIWSLLLVFSMIFTSCEKQQSDSDIAILEDDALAETLFDDLFAIADEAEKNLYVPGGVKSTAVDSCPLITVDHPDTTTFPKIITIDYGDGCEGFYGHTRAGMVKITITGRYRTPGSTKTIELINYVINGIAVEGTKTITNDGLNNNGNLSYTIALSGGQLTLPDGSSATRTFTREREWLAGSDTYNPWDDVYLITGTVTGNNFSNEDYTRTILSPLEAALSCRFIKSGSIEFVVGDRPTMVLDYGDGACDALATVSIDGGDPREITLRFHHRRFRP